MAITRYHLALSGFKGFLNPESLGGQESKVGFAGSKGKLPRSWGFPGGSDSKESACNMRDQVRSLGLEHPLEKGMATHSSILAWEIPWTEEPGGLQSMGSQRVGHN